MKARLLLTFLCGVFFIPYGIAMDSPGDDDTPKAPKAPPAPSLSRALVVRPKPLTALEFDRAEEGIFNKHCLPKYVTDLQKLLASGSLYVGNPLPSSMLITAQEGMRPGRIAKKVASLLGLPFEQPLPSRWMYAYQMRNAIYPTGSDAPKADRLVYVHSLGRVGRKHDLSDKKSLSTFNTTFQEMLTRAEEDSHVEIQPNTHFIASAYLPELVDDKLKAKFKKVITIAALSKTKRVRILFDMCKAVNRGFVADSFDFASIADGADVFTFDDIKRLVVTAARKAVLADRVLLAPEDLMAALAEVKKSRAARAAVIKKLLAKRAGAEEEIDTKKPVSSITFADMAEGSVPLVARYLVKKIGELQRRAVVEVDSDLDASLEAATSSDETTAKVPKIVITDATRGASTKSKIVVADAVVRYYKTKPPRGILIWGPPGTGKTMLAQAIAGEAGKIPFERVSAALLVNKFIGESAQNVKRLFDKIKAKLKRGGVGILFVDEAERLLMPRGRSGSTAGEEIEAMTAALLSSMEGFVDGKKVVVICATNFDPKRFDAAARRRFTHILETKLPDQKTRVNLLIKIWRNEIWKIGQPDPDFYELARETDGFSGGHLRNMLEVAAELADMDDAPYINCALMLSSKRVPVLDSKSKPVLRSDGKPKTKWEWGPESHLSKALTKEKLKIAASKPPDWMYT